MFFTGARTVENGKSDSNTDGNESKRVDGEAEVKVCGEFFVWFFYRGLQ